MKHSLSPIERRALKALAHALDPVVMIGDQGLTPAVILEVERNLKAHELIKVRAATDDREARESWLQEICKALHAAPVQHIGKILIIWRKKPEVAEKNVAAGKTDRRTGAKSRAKPGEKFGVKSGVTTRSQRKPREKGVAVPTSKGTGKGSSGFGTRVSAKRQTRTK